MAKKINLETTAKQVENISNTINVIMQNRLIIAIFLIVDGITFIMNPGSTLSEMAKNIILLMLFAALTILITNLAAKQKNLKVIITSVIILAVGGFFYFYPDLIAAYIQLLLSLFIIYNGVSSIAKALHMNRLSRFTAAIKEKLDKKPTKRAPATEDFKEVDNSIDQGLEEQAAKLISPLQNIIGKTDKRSVLFIMVNVLSVILGIILLVFPDVSMVIWGLIFLYTGATNFLVAAKTIDLVGKLKRGKLKEIFLK
ncbi:hypothetical protein IKG68_01700 [Candidatus Saccharibacteria bacterium]|nr:hypothetical protein [Candidatus Saccharibacteria bacterium]